MTYLVHKQLRYSTEEFAHFSSTIDGEGETQVIELEPLIEK